MSWIQAFDQSAIDAIQGLRHPVADVIMPGISFLGTLGWFWIVIGVALILRRKTRPCGFAVLIALMLGNILGNFIIKPLVARARPFTLNPAFELLVEPEASYSFPSGHTITGFAAATAIACARLRRGWIAFIPAALIAFSRVYLYLHFPTDVLAGALLGALCGWAAHSMARSGFKRYEQRRGRDATRGSG